MTSNLSAILYLISAVCFILALKGLSSPASARSGNMFGIAGMTIAVVTTLLAPNVSAYLSIFVAVAAGAAIGTITALRMTAMPQLVAAFHSLVGLAAVLVAAAALYAPEAYGIGSSGDIKSASLIEMSLGAVIGAITFTGSIIAFAKLQALMSGSPIVFPGQHLLNLLAGLVIIGLIVLFCLTGGGSYSVFWAMITLALLLGILIIIPIFFAIHHPHDHPTLSLDQCLHPGRHDSP